MTSSSWLGDPSRPTSSSAGAEGAEQHAYRLVVGVDPADPRVTAEPRPLPAGEAPGAEDGLARLALSQQIFPDAEPSHSERFRANGLASSTVVVKAFRLVHILSVEGS